MQRRPGLFRLSATVATIALLWDAVVLPAAVAQPAPPPLPAPGQGRPEANQADPPERVGRIANMTGTVSFHNSGDTQWSAATPNYPVSSGNAFWTEPSSEAQLEISASRIAMAGGTEFDVATLDASGLQGVAAQGEIYLHLRDLVPNEAWAIQTPRGLVRLSGEGRYEITVGTTDQPTLVTVVEGAARIDGPNVSLQVAGNQTATVTGADSFQGSVGPALRDRFLTAQLDAERPPSAPAVPVPAQVVAMPGGSDLTGTGSWSQAPNYGQVWYPPVPATWVPYREGHWAYVQPWGWTWIDDARWGFAPFHYGRWVQIDERWAWTPGEAVAERPVYAPALVTFIGIGAGVALGAALAAGSIGWVPLGPREQFHPWYHASNTYIRQVNVSHVTNINNNVTINNYINRGAATAIPAAVMSGSRPVQAVARPVTAQEFAAARPVSGQQPLRPTAATAGVTPVVARQLNLAPAAAALRPAPGPTVRTQAAGTNGFARPEFARSELARPELTRPELTRPGVTPAASAPAPAGPTPGLQGARPANVPNPEPGHPGPHPQLVQPGQAAQPRISRPEGSRATGAPAPEAGRAAVLPQGAPRQPGAVTSQGAPVVQHPGPAAAQLAPNPGPHPVPQPAPHPVTEPAARPAAQPIAPQPPAVQRPTPAAAPRVEPHPAAPRPEPQHAAPPPPRPEARAAAPVHPEPREHKKEPGER